MWWGKKSVTSIPDTSSCLIKWQTLLCSPQVTSILTDIAWVFCFLTLCKWNHTVYVLLCVLISQIFLWNWSILFWVSLANTFYCVPLFEYSTSCLSRLCWWTFDFSAWGYLWIMLLGAILTFPIVHDYMCFSWVCTLDWNCWVIWDPYVYFS